MKVVMPIAGRGSRFTNVGIKIPKPLIPVLGKPMVQRAVESIPFVPLKDYIFIAQKDHQKKFGLGDKLKELFGKDVKIIYINKVTEGAACTVLLAEDLINTNEDLLLMDTDHYFKATLEKAIEEKELEVSGIIPVHLSNDPKWSFTKIDRKGDVIEVAEKKPISKYANVGSYYFSRGKDFVWAAKKMIKKNIRVNNEFYVAPVYNQLVNDGHKIKILIADEMWEMGTPSDLEYFVKNFRV